MTTLPTVLSADEADRILAQPNRRALSGLRNRCMMEVMYRCGLRVSELVSLRPQDVRLGDRPRIELRAGTKGGKARSVLVPGSLVPLLEQWNARRPASAFYFPTTCERGGQAAGNKAGAQLTPRYVQLAVKRYADKASVDRKVTPHTFRHTYATNLLAAGFTIREVQVLLGHSHVNTTMIYTHVSHESMADRFATM